MIVEVGELKPMLLRRQKRRRKGCDGDAYWDVRQDGRDEQAARLRSPCSSQGGSGAIVGIDDVTSPPA